MFTIFYIGSANNNCGKENTEDAPMKSEIFAVSLRREKKKELLGIKRMKNLNAKIKNFYGSNVNNEISGSNVKPLNQIEERKIGEVIGRMSSSGLDRSIAYLQITDFKTMFVIYL